MEVDSVHSVIGEKIEKAQPKTPQDMAAVVPLARKSKAPYGVQMMEPSDFRNWVASAEATMGKQG